METIQNDNSSPGFGSACLLSSVVTALGAGALLMYLFDPDRGRGRRARLKDQATSKVNLVASAAGSKARDLRNRAQGVVHDLGSRNAKEGVGSVESV